ncbi:MAG: signal peptidase II, partial [Oscillospiraceae bacterium]
MILIISLIAVVVLIVIDQLIKHWAVTVLMPVGAMDFIKFGDLDIIGLTYVQNDGAAFSSFSGAKIFLIVLTSLMIVGLIIFALRDKTKHPFMMLSTAAVVA